MATYFSAQFTGGMNEVIHPSLLDEKTASLLRNATVENGKIVSIKMPQLTPANTPEDIRHYGRINRSVVKWYQRNYWSINDAYSAPFYGGDVENYLGIPYVDYEQDVKIALQDGELSGEYKYCVTLVNPNGWEGAPGAVLDYERAVTLENNSVDITVSWSDSRVAYAKIYRTADHGADFYCVGEVKKSGEVFHDETDDYTLAGLESLSSTDNYPPPDNGKYLCESGGVFFLAVDSTLYFSSLGNPHAWPKLNFIGFDDIITGYDLLCSLAELFKCYGLFVEYDLLATVAYLDSAFDVKGVDNYRFCDLLLWLCVYAAEDKNCSHHNRNYCQDAQ